MKAARSSIAASQSQRCFACDKLLGKNPTLVDTHDSQTAYVGSSCFNLIMRAGDNGYQPPKGGPRLYQIKRCDGCSVNIPWEHRCQNGKIYCPCECYSEHPAAIFKATEPS